MLNFLGRNLIVPYFQWLGRLYPMADALTRQRIGVGLLASFMGVFFSLALGLPLFFYGLTAVAWLFVVLGVWEFVGIVVFLKLRLPVWLWAYYNFGGLLVVNFTGTMLLGGAQSSGMLIIWSLLPPLLAPVLLDTRHTIFFSLIFLGLFVASLIVPENAGYTYVLPPELKKALIFFNVGGMSTFILITIQFFVAQRNQYQERSDDLLLNVLPREIADILRNENRVIADHFDGASILFADVVNFTPLSATMTPTELVNLLNEVFSHFDSLVEKYGLEKIKTIGDCYMVASGVPRPRADHAQVLTQMALEMQTYVTSHEFMGRKLAFRIGINSGAVVAGVIGRKKFIYDLWGDAVNTASRMESHGSGGITQITRATYELIKDHFVCEPRGTVNVKGKGEMEVWSVIGALP